MLLSLNKKIFEMTLNTTDRIVQPILKDKTYLRLTSFQMNSFLSIQKLVEIHTEKVLKGMNIPTQKNLKSLYKTVYELEQYKAESESKIHDLKEKVMDLEKKLAKKFPATPRKRASIVKKNKEVTV